MKSTDKNNEKKKKIKKKPIDKSKKKQVVVVAQEIKFARLLSGNEKKTRDRVLRALKKWLLNCFEKNYEFKEEDFTRVWKGLFYAVWMSDKPLVQEDLCESIAGILDLFPPEQLSAALLMVRAGFRMLATEWFGLDQHRIDKFLMLVRRYLRGSLRVLRRCEWSEPACAQFADMLASKDGILALKTPLYARNATSMVLHVADCYLEEVSKVSAGAIPPGSVCELLRPFLSYLAQGSCVPLCVASRRLVADLMKYGETEGDNEGDDNEMEQGSDDENGDEVEDGDENEEEANEGDEGNEDGDSDEEMGERPLDPRAGRVDVTLAALPVPAAELAAALRSLLPRASGAGHRRARTAIALLEQFSSGKNPFDRETILIEPTPPLRPTRAARALRVLEKKLVAAGDELAMRGLSRKHRRRLLARARAGHAVVDDLPNRTDRHTHQNGDWQVEDADISTKISKKKRKLANKENEPKTKKQKLEETPNVDNTARAKKQKKGKLGKVNVDGKNNIENVKHNAVKVKHNVAKVKTDDNVKNNINKVKNNVEKSKSDVENVKVNVNKVRNNVEKVKNNVDNGASNVKTGKDVKVKENKSIDVKSDKNVKEKVNTAKDKHKPKDAKHVKSKQENVKTEKSVNSKSTEAKLLVNKIKKFQKQDKSNSGLNDSGLATPKKVKFVLKNNSTQGTIDYYKSVRQSPNIPFDSSKQPNKTNLKVNTPSPINPFFKKKMTRRASFAAQIVY